MMISLKSKLRIAEGTLVRDLDGEAILLNIKTEQYYGLDEVGTRMLVALTESASVQAALDQLLEEYEVDADELQRDALQLANNLITQGLIDVR